MNITPNPALYQRIIKVGPLRCMAGFLTKSSSAAQARGDHGAAMEIEVTRQFMLAENIVRHTAAAESAGIRDHVGQILETATRIAEDNIITEDEERELHAELTTLCTRSRRHAAALTRQKLLPL